MKIIRRYIPLILLNHAKKRMLHMWKLVEVLKNRIRATWNGINSNFLTNTFKNFEITLM